MEHSNRLKRLTEVIESRGLTIKALEKLVGTSSRLHRIIKRDGAIPDDYLDELMDAMELNQEERYYLYFGKKMTQSVDPIIVMQLWMEKVDRELYDLRLLLDELRSDYTAIVSASD